MRNASRFALLVSNSLEELRGIYGAIDVGIGGHIAVICIRNRAMDFGNWRADITLGGTA